MKQSLHVQARRHVVVREQPVGTVACFDLSWSRRSVTLSVFEVCQQSEFTPTMQHLIQTRACSPPGQPSALVVGTMSQQPTRVTIPGQGLKGIVLQNAHLDSVRIAVSMAKVVEEATAVMRRHPRSKMSSSERRSRAVGAPPCADLHKPWKCRKN